MASMSTTVTSSPQPVVNNYTVTYNLTTSTKFNPSMAIIIVVLMSALFFLGFFSIYVRNCTMADGEEASSGGHNTRPTAQTSSSSRPKGLDKSVVEALPVVHFKDLNLEMQDGNAGLDDGKPPEECRQDVHRECAVCLSEFESEDSLRLLPKCKHVFHLECIDVWFQSHSTCPLCRASLVPKETQHGHDAREGEDQAESVVIVGEQGRAGDGAAYEEAPLEVVLTIDPDDSGEGARESQEDTQSAVLQVDSTRSGTTTEGTSRSVESSISRDDQRDTARLALFRNSQSFKKAARGVVAHERAGTSTVSNLETWTSLKSWKAPTPGNEPMHRSTSLDIDGKSMKDVFSSSQTPKLVSQHSVPAAMNLATINLPMESKLGIQRTGSYSGLELLRTDSMNSVEKAPFTGSKPIRSNSEHWVRIELDSAPESLGVGPSKTKPVLQLGLDESPIINRGIKTGNFERWSFLNLQNTQSLQSII